MATEAGNAGREVLRLAFAASLVLASAWLWAEPAPSQLLPASERFLYSRTIGDKRDEVRTAWRLVAEKGVSWYEVSTLAADQDSLIRLDPANLFANYIEVTSRGKDATLRRVTTVLENRSGAKPGEIVLSTFEALPYSLRAFPWGSLQKAKVSFLGSGGAGNFGFDFSVTGKETLSVGGRGVECWKAQLSLGGIMGAFFGKSSLWYSVDYPHYLVKSEGAGGPPGTPASVLTLVSYSSEADPAPGR
jgi:hypothetical protein